ncbi:MAG: hypothetical protein V1649_00345 [Patescibacteria group bacterium]
MSYEIPQIKDQTETNNLEKVYGEKKCPNCNEVAYLEEIKYLRPADRKETDGEIIGCRTCGTLFEFFKSLKSKDLPEIKYN